MQTLLILQGPPACGKSTYARTLAESNEDYIIVNRDALRRMRGKYWIPAQEDLITDWEMDCIALGLFNRFNVIVDATNLNPKTLARILNLGNVKGLLAENKLKIEYKMFDTSLEECLKRDAIRKESVGEKVIRDFFNRYMVKKVETEFNVERITQNNNLAPAIICDIDGTVALTNGRSHYDYSRVKDDLPNENVRKLVKRLMMSEGYYIIYLSGREDSCYDDTVSWLKKYDIWDNECQLFMRKTGDHRKDCIIKKEIFDAEIKDKYFVEFCLDDRDQVVKLWRDMGLTCLQVAYGNF